MVDGAIQEYATDITELDAATLNRLIKEMKFVHRHIDSDRPDTFLLKFILISNPSRKWNGVTSLTCSRRTVLN